MLPYAPYLTRTCLPFTQPSFVDAISLFTFLIFFTLLFSTIFSARLHLYTAGGSLFHVNILVRSIHIPQLRCSLR